MNTRPGPPGGELGAHQGRHAPGMGVAPPPAVSVQGRAAGPGRGLALLRGFRSGSSFRPVAGFSSTRKPGGGPQGVHPPGARVPWASSPFLLRSQLKSICAGVFFVGEVFKLLEEEGVSLSELEPAPLDSL